MIAKNNRLSERLRAIERREFSFSEHDKDGINFADGYYRIRPANDLKTRRAAYELVYRLYREKGYADPRPSGMWLSLFDVLPETVTLVVEHGKKVVGCLTVVFDSSFGLPADELYRDELNRMRKADRRLAEIISFGVDPEAQFGNEILVKLFNCIYLVARKIRRATDFINTVNPRHTGFYKRTLLFEKAGDVRYYDKVGGAPAALMKLDLRKGEKYIYEAHNEAGDQKEYKHTLLKYFYSPLKEEAAVIEELKRSLHPMNEEEIRYFLMDETDIWYKAEFREQYYLEKRCSLAAVTVA
ncbi:hypothetical protein ACFL6F_03020 [Planctomycetota bacterium]